MTFIQKYDIPITYAAKHISIEERLASQSGGAFAAFSSYVLEQGGIVYGCALDQLLNAVHMRADTIAERDKMRGSKYVQSRMNDVFHEVKADLVQGKLVLFTGTSCQIAGLQAYLGKNYDNLLLVDIICHGVPSPTIWHKYLDWQEKRRKSKAVRVDFRNKRTFGWRKHYETLWFENGASTSNSIYSSLFYSHYFLRPCCYKCPYKSVIHPGNITIGDYWGIETVEPSWDDDKGISIVLINDEIGEKWFGNVKHLLQIKKTEVLPSLQIPLEKPFNEPEGREDAWKIVKNGNFKKVLSKYTDYTMMNRFVNALRLVRNKLIRS